MCTGQLPRTTINRTYSNFFHSGTLRRGTVPSLLPLACAPVTNLHPASPRRALATVSHPASSSSSDAAASDNPPITTDTLVIGAGPGGLTAVACMLDKGAPSLTWIDPHFLGGRWGERYGEVPSNTKVRLFLDFVRASPFLSQLVAEAPQPNAYTHLAALPQDKGCPIRAAADLVVFVAQQMQLRRTDRVRMLHGHVLGLQRHAGSWTARVQADSGATSAVACARVVLATGSEPVAPPDAPAGRVLDLDTALTPTALRRWIDAAAPRALAVVGSSHSAVLALKNITDVAPALPVTHYFRHALRYAEEMDGGWILHDNTGLKGVAAAWARETYPRLARISKVQLPADRNDEATLYRRELQGADAAHDAVYAVGFRALPAPEVRVDGEAEPRRIAYDDRSGRFDVPGLFGCGIAYPERVTDPRGNVEHAVGMWKFMKYVKRVSGDWV